MTTPAIPRETAVRSLQTFTDRRGAVVGGDTDHFAYDLRRFLKFCKSDPLVSAVVAGFDAAGPVDVGAVLSALDEGPHLDLPDDLEGELSTYWALLNAADENDGVVFHFGSAFGGDRQADWVNHFRTIVVRPFAKEMSRRVGESAQMASREARDLQAVPLDRIPGPGETGVFLSHKGTDKPLVRRYYHALKEVGFAPWLDEEALPAGSTLDRGLHGGLAGSCAAVFFITPDFKDEGFLADEIDHAQVQKRKKGAKFAIVILVFDDAPVPPVLERYVWKSVSNDLEGFRELVRGLPLELGDVRWKTGVV